MLVFKKADLEIEQGGTSAYTDTPMHSVKAIAVSLKRFLDRTTNWTSLLAQRADVTALPHSPPHTNISECDAVLDGLQLKLDNYLHEPQVGYPWLMQVVVQCISNMAKYLFLMVTFLCFS